MKRIIRWGSVAVLALVCVWGLELYELTGKVSQQALRDEAQKADVIVVLGAAEYHGRPSPVLRGRLDHALVLYQKGLAGKILTTGGAGGDPIHTEAEVSRQYLANKGVPVENIYVEREGESTAQSTAAGAEIIKRMGWSSCIVVSDGYHLFRAKKMMEAHGMTCYGSPRPAKELPGWKEAWLYFRQAVGYSLYEKGLRF
jgi:uncharacterized SAM-binding protein YcdF (DUF218 family)